MLWRSKLTLVLLFALLLAVLTGCSGRRKWVDEPPEVAWAKIQDKYERKKYLDAVDHLEIFLINHAGSSMADSAQFMLAESHFYMKEYIIAASEYEKLVSQYPQSPLVETASYKIGLSYYKLSPKYSLDQSYTQRAFDALQLFLEEFPGSEYTDDAMEMIDEIRSKLAKKVYENGRLYQKTKEYKSAHIYYDQILEDFYDTQFAPEALFQKAVMEEEVADTAEAIQQYTKFLDKYPNDPLEPRARNGLNRMLGRAQSIAGSMRLELFGTAGFNTYRMRDLNRRLERWGDYDKEMETLSFGGNLTGGMRVVMPRVGAVGLNVYRMVGETSYYDNTGSLKYKIPANVIEATVAYHLVKGEDLDVYAGLGVGLYMPEGSLYSSFYGDEITYPNYSPYYEQFDSAFIGYRPYIRAQTFVFPRVSVLMGLGYRVAGTESRQLGDDGERVQLDWNGLSVSAGVSIVLFSW